MKDTCDLNLPEHVRYADDHEWICVKPPYLVGISDYAQDRMGDLTFIELPEPGAVLAKGDEFCTLESTKSVSPMYSPVDGRIKAVNAALTDDPGLPNRDPYGQGWIIEVEPDDRTQINALMDLAAYRKHLGKGEKA